VGAAGSVSAVLEQLRSLKIVPLIVIDDPDKAEPLARALQYGGIPCAEIAFRTPAAVEALRTIAAEQPEVLVGAGTVLTVTQAVEARRAGARFVVSPGLSRPVVEYCREHGVPVFPGACTPTDVTAAVELGLKVLKFFPAEPIGGLTYLKALAAPFPDIEFIPTGGVSASNLGAYLAFKPVVACGGSWMAPQRWIAAGDFDRVRRAVEQAARLARQAEA
jgi:2-dehydro-3-deoxyphosphogluconate aldolase/(4S)-4-hydroxy-2-oxoglutarate aldolase